MEFNEVLEEIILFTTIWSIGANLNTIDRECFSDKIHEVSTKLPSGNVFDF